MNVSYMVPNLSIKAHYVVFIEKKKKKNVIYQGPNKMILLF